MTWYDKNDQKGFNVATLLLVVVYSHLTLSMKGHEITWQMAQRWEKISGLKTAQVHQ